MENLKTIVNGAPAAAMFTAAEMNRRLDALRATMAEAGIDAALFTSYHNINYFSGFLYCSFGRPYGLAVTADEATTISANIDGGQPNRRGTTGNLVYTDWRRDNYFEAVKRLLGGRGRIGIETDHLTLQAHDKLRAALPDAKLVDIAAPIMRGRMVKSGEEIALIREGALAAEVDGVEKVAEGVGDDEERAMLVGYPAQRLHMADAAHVLAQAEREDVAHVRGDLHPVRNEEVGVLLAVLGQDELVPQPVVLAEVDGGEAAATGLLRQIVGVEAAVGGPPSGVDVHVDNRAHRGSIAIGPS